MIFFNKAFTIQLVSLYVARRLKPLRKINALTAPNNDKYNNRSSTWFINIIKTCMALPMLDNRESSYIVYLMLDMAVTKTQADHTILTCDPQNSMNTEAFVLVYLPWILLICQRISKCILQIHRIRPALKVQEWKFSDEKFTGLKMAVYTNPTFPHFLQLLKMLVPWHQFDIIVIMVVWDSAVWHC